MLSLIGVPQKVWKKYLGISNVVVRLSNGTQASRDDAILINAHLDSTLPSPGKPSGIRGVRLSSFPTLRYRCSR
jgi:Zn-dependent M28 family amino/carboxypeptidase